METAERVHISLRCHIVSKDTVAHSQLPGFIQAIARMTSNNEAFRLNLRGDARRRREVVHMADWPAPDPQAWQPPAPVTSQSLTSQAPTGIGGVDSSDVGRVGPRPWRAGVSIGLSPDRQSA
jgi:hypothetical protein